MSTANTIISRLTPAEVSKRVGVSERMVRKASHENLMPAVWFDIIEAMSLEAGIDCPRDAFSFKPDAAPKLPVVERDGAAA